MYFLSQASAVDRYRQIQISNIDIDRYGKVYETYIYIDVDRLIRVDRQIQWID